MRRISGCMIWFIVFALLDLNYACQRESEMLGPFASEIEKADYYVATNGNDINSGSYEKPFATWQKAVDIAVAGDTIYIRGGIYRTSITSGRIVDFSDVNGEPGNMISVMAYPGERPVYDLSNIEATNEITGIYFSNTDYVHIKGLTIRNIIQRGMPYHFGMYLTNGSDHNIVDNMEFSYIGGYGFMIYNDDLAVCNDDLILNCDSHHNSDPISKLPSGLPYCKSDGFSVAYGGLGCDSHIIFKGCRAWWNSDDGFDANGSQARIIFDSCWSFRNGYIPGSFVLSGGNGFGFKLGETHYETDTLRVLRNCLSFDNIIGIHPSDNDATCITTVYNSVAFRNTIGIYLKNATSTVKNSIAYSNTFNTSLSDNGYTINHDHNSWDSDPTILVTDDDFINLDTSGVSNSRGFYGEIPVLDFLKLANGSELIDAGIYVGIPFKGKNPDIGAMEIE